MIWCVFSCFSYAVDNWGCVDFLCCLAGIFRRFHWEFTKRYMCVLFGLNFCWFFFFGVSISFKRYIFCAFFVEILVLLFYEFKDFSTAIVLIFLVIWDYL